MGAISITRSGKARNIKEAWKYIQDEDKEEYGEDSYNGASNNCHLVKDVTSEWKAFKGTQDEFCGKLIERASKREMYGFCIEEPKANTNKTKSIVNNIPQKGTRKWITKYVGRNRWTGEDAIGVVAETQTECIKKARAYVEKNPNEKLEIYITKTLEKGNAICAEVQYKTSSTEKLGKYVFAGWAPY